MDDSAFAGGPAKVEEQPRLRELPVDASPPLPCRAAKSIALQRAVDRQSILDRKKRARRRSGGEASIEHPADQHMLESVPDELAQIEYLHRSAPRGFGGQVEVRGSILEPRLKRASRDRQGVRGSQPERLFQCGRHLTQSLRAKLVPADCPPQGPAKPL